MNYIVLYAEDFSDSVWADYCDICGESYNAISLTIPFDMLAVTAEYSDKDIFARSAVLINDALEDALLQYSAENIDVVVNEDGMVVTMYHSDNDSFIIGDTICSVEDIDFYEVESIANYHHIGYCLE